MKNKSAFVMLVVWMFAQGLGFIGGIIVLYSLLAELTMPWQPLESIAPQLGAILTVAGAILTAGLIYFEQPRYRPPWNLSIYITAPIVIFAGLVAVTWFFWTGDLPPNTVNGFGLLAISGGLLRQMPYPDPT
jgi:MFS family permease